METTKNITVYLFVLSTWMVSAGFAQPSDPAGNSGQGQDDGVPGPALAMSFRPGIAVTIVVLTTMFTLTFLLLLYAKHCKVAAARGGRRVGRGGVHGSPDQGRLALSAGNLSRKDSGIERSIIDALPVFKFASLQGMKEGLECAVCLSRFEGSEVLRLLPKCRHAFHVDCVDTWLESHSTCPLCRHRVEAQDVLMVFRHDENVEEAKGLDDRTPQLMQVFVQRENVENAEGESESSGFRVGNSFRQPSARLSEAAGSIGCFGSGRKEGLLLSEADEESKKIQFSRRFAHRIVVSDVMSQHRWSDRKPSDLLFLSSQMITTDSGRMAFTDVKPTDEIETTSRTAETKRPDEHSAAEIDTKRSMSEIVGLNRFRSRSTRNNNTLLPVTKSGETDEQKWFSIAGKTLQWLAGKGNGSGSGSGTEKFLH